MWKFEFKFKLMQASNATRRFKLNKTNNEISKEIPAQQQYNNNVNELKCTEQKAKIESMIKESQSEQLSLFKEIMQADIEDYDAKLVEFIPCRPPPTEDEPTSSFAKYRARSLAEATLITNFQLFSYGCQTILASCVPLIVEQYKLSLLQKNSQSEHLQQLEVVKFGNELSQRLAMPYQAYNQDFAKELERIFKLCLEDFKLPDELEQQELTLNRIDFASEIINEKVVLNHVSNYPILRSNQSKNKHVDKFIDHKQFFTEESSDQSRIKNQHEQIQRISEKLRLRKEQLIRQLNE